jgi:hypothetical protein
MPPDEFIFTSETLVTSLIIVTIKLLTEKNAYVENPVTVLSYIKVLYSPVAGYFLWFIWALWWMFVIAPIFRSKRLRITGFAIALLLHYMPISITTLFCLEQARIMMVYFFLGIVAYDYREVYIGYTKKLGIPVILLFAGGEYVFLEHLSVLGGGNREHDTILRNCNSNVYFNVVGTPSNIGL